MQKLIVISLLLVLGAGAAVSFLMYRQIGTDIVTLTGAPELVANGQGQACGDVGFAVKARSLGLWLYNVPKGKTLTGAFTVVGNDQQDIGFSIWSPTNRIVLFEEDRAHELEFEVVGTIRGEYRFEFDNRHSSFTEKKFTVTVCVA